MDTTNVPQLDLLQRHNILSCVRQRVRDGNLPNEFFVISVWFSDIANRLLKSNTPSNGYCVMVKKEDGYTKPDIIAHAKKIWDLGYVPVEVVQKEGAIFWALPRQNVMANDLNEEELIYAETIN